MGEGNKGERRSLKGGRIGVIAILMMLVSAGISVSANQPPVALANPDHQDRMVGEWACFDGFNSTDPDGYIVNYTWDMWGGTPEHAYGDFVCTQYFSPGYYDVTLWVLDDGGLYDWDNATVYVNGTGPTAVVKPDHQDRLVGEYACFDGYDSTDSDGYITNYTWYLSPGTPSSAWGAYACTQFFSPGNYSIWLRVLDNNMTEGWDSATVRVNYTNPPADMPPSIIVNQPGGSPGQMYEQGDIVEVWWNASDDKPLPPYPINITYGTPMGGWTTVATFEANDGLYSWYTSSVPCPAVYWMNLSVFDSIGQTTFDMSEFYFYMNCVVDDPPAAPALQKAVLKGPGNANVELTWTLSADDGAGENDVVGYEVYLGTAYASDGTGYALLASLPAGTTAYVHAGAGDGDWNNYFYYVLAEDAIGQKAWEGQAGKYVRTLKGGEKELVSIPLVQDDTQILEVLKTIAGSYDIVRYYKSSDQADHWKSFKPEKPAASNDFYYIDHKIGFWIKMWSDDRLVVAGLVPETTTLTLEPSWNLIGYSSFTPKTVADALSGISYTKVQGWSDTHPEHQKNLGDGDIMSVGNAYWIRVDSTQVLVLTN